MLERDAAMQILTGSRGRARSAILRGDVTPQWHPTGFVVFHLGEISQRVGRLRLHVWPSGGQKDLPGHPPIHSHSWELSSPVLAGQS
jgi:hypothetical protein